MGDDFLFVGVEIDNYFIARANFAGQQQFGKFILEVFLNCALERASTELHVASFGRNEVLGFVAYCYAVSKAADALVETGEFDVDDLVDRVAVECVENDNIVDTVEEFGRESFVESLREHAVRVFAVDFAGVESDTAAKFLELACADVRSHD